MLVHDADLPRKREDVLNAPGAFMDQLIEACFPSFAVEEANDALFSQVYKPCVLDLLTEFLLRHVVCDHTRPVLRRFALSTGVHAATPQVRRVRHGRGLQWLDFIGSLESLGVDLQLLSQLLDVAVVSLHKVLHLMLHLHLAVLFELPSRESHLLVETSQYCLGLLLHNDHDLSHLGLNLAHLGQQRVALGQ